MLSVACSLALAPATSDACADAVLQRSCCTCKACWVSLQGLTWMPAAVVALRCHRRLLQRWRLGGRVQRTRGVRSRCYRCRRLRGCCPVPKPRLPLSPVRMLSVGEMTAEHSVRTVASILQRLIPNPRTVVSTSGHETDGTSMSGVRAVLIGKVAGWAQLGQMLHDTQSPICFKTRTCSVMRTQDTGALRRLSVPCCICADDSCPVAPG